ncbi:D-tyrosyl-tRNA(Tyr) deacylase [Vagococcus coleopterorum]|uniref:D-aminoacyl-tRNA deacylase n=1 Tax=Vagococcus coleopterorum TaxID=2714946 RepID=A0A6G8AMC4_9ENTE|nr:D-aminoacyl-tRNA deacylase [Vagococcus coleopterorum]QIL46102.1 D-tyrosyl-tRNA(Tyr) deacylase [Vagococcus coleopterorum]
MKVVIQKVTSASVVVEEQTIAKIGQGFLLLVGVKTGDTQADADYLVNKIAKMRIFEDAEGKMNHDISEVSGEVLSVSQFTLLANTKKGNRPSFVDAARPNEATKLYDYFNEGLRGQGLEVSEGQFGADMSVSLVNDGPTTIILDTENK